MDIKPSSVHLFHKIGHIDTSDTVHHIADALDEESDYHKGSYMLLLNFAYEIRHAYQGTRLTEQMSFGEAASLLRFPARVDRFADLY